MNYLPFFEKNQTILEGHLSQEEKSFILKVIEEEMKSCKNEEMISQLSRLVQLLSCSLEMSEEGPNRLRLNALTSLASTDQVKDLILFKLQDKILANVSMASLPELITMLKIFLNLQFTWERFPFKLKELIMSRLSQLLSSSHLSSRTDQIQWIASQTKNFQSLLETLSLYPSLIRSKAFEPVKAAIVKELTHSLLLYHTPKQCSEVLKRYGISSQVFVLFTFLSIDIYFSSFYL